jgi:hypothetical protein
LQLAALDDERRAAGLHPGRAVAIIMRIASNCTKGGLHCA